MFWIVILITVLLVVGASVLVGVVLNKRGQRRRPRGERQRQVDMAKASGAFSHRKSNQP